MDLADRPHTSPPASAAPFELQAEALGGVVHRTLAQSLPDAVGDDDIRRAVSRQITGGRAIGPAMRNRAVALCLRYTRLFLPPPPATFLGAEIRHLDTVFDLVWEHDGQVWVDEIKTGAASIPAQVRSELDTGLHAWGDSFAGVRVIPLASPRHVFLARPGAQP